MTWFLRNKWLCFASNIVAIGLAVLIGYLAATPDRVEHSNPNIVFCSLVFIATTIVGFCWVRRAVRGSDCVGRPSLFRSFFEQDRLQWACAGALLWLSSAVGTTLRIAGGGPKTFWYVTFVWSMAVGFAAGEAIGIVIYRNEIDAI